ncbi:MAG: UDP-N-acetylmuramoyl-tripeptide--D-alanyl-D-alanine ligase [Phycisphaerae bacterium]|nr:UDP-N-acetylmuramoyl-tripeptide--D-alanyl-D-alanine ligase [Phycisphaerae bacterium]
MSHSTDFWTPESIRAASGGAWLARAVVATPLVGLGIDSRTLLPGQVFLALRGARFDGHEFLSAAMAAGSPLLIVERPEALAGLTVSPHLGVLQVEDSRRALLRLAAAYRRTLESTKVVAVTGSNGKTTTTRLIAGLLAARWRGTSSVKSYNNDIGVPLTVLAARPSDQFLVCEVGMNHAGEIARLAAVVQPDVGVITSIGRAHIENLGSIEAIAREKASLFAALRPGGLAVAPADASALAEHLRGLPHVLTFGRAAHADLRLTSYLPQRSAGGFGCRFTVNDRSAYTLPLAGEHNALNAVAALAVARRLGLDDETISAALATATGPEMRFERRVIGGMDVVNDAYNANPDSALTSLRAFADSTPDASRRVLILGDMLEQGEAGPDAHREVAHAVLEMGAFELVIGVGPLSAHACAVLAGAWPPARVVHVGDTDPAGPARAAALLRPGDAVLVKGSRGVRLERFVEAIERRARGAPEHGVETPPAFAPTPFTR